MNATQVILAPFQSLRWAVLGLALGACALPLHAQRWTHETLREFHVTGDFDGDGMDDLSVIDKATGIVRSQLGIQRPIPPWAALATTGVSNVTGVTVGRLLSVTRDALAVTAPEANRIQLLSLASSTSPWTISSFYVTNHGPSTLAALDLPGAGNNPAVDDLFLGSVWDGALPNQRSLWRNTLSALSPLGASALPGVPDNAQAFAIKTNSPPQVAILLRHPLGDRLLISSNNAGLPATTASASLPSSSEYLAAPFEAMSPLARFLIWQPGSSNLWRFPVEEAAGFSFGASNHFSLGHGIERVVALPGANALRLAILHSGGTAQSIYTWDGTSALPVLLWRTNAPTGETFTGAIPLGDFSFISLTSNDTSGRTTTARAVRWNGSTYTVGSANPLPSLDHFSGQANVLLFEQEPFVSPTPGLLASRNASDWSSSIRLAPSIIVTQETFATPQLGVTTPVQVDLGASPVGSAFALGNQVSNFMSLFSLRAPVGAVVSEVNIDPPPGVYDSGISVRFTPVNSSRQVWYQLNQAGPWQLYTAPLQIGTATAVSYYGKTAGGTAKSIIRTAVYTINASPQQLDSDGDGVPDYVERQRGLDPLAGTDTDGDGWSDFEELVYGTDPSSNASRPGTAAVPLTLNAGFLIEARPKPRDPFSDQVVKAELGTLVRVHHITGGFVGEETVALPAERAARFSNVVADVSQPLLALRTEPHFDIETTNSDTRIGRELLSLFPVPGFAPITVSNGLYTGSNPAADAAAWIAAAASAVSNAPARVVDAGYGKFDTLTALLVERKLAELLGQRGTNWSTNLTLFPQRPNDISRSNLTLAALQSLERYNGPALPAYRVTALFDAIDAGVKSGSLPGVNAAKLLTTEIYRVSMLSNNSAPGVYALPADVLRDFIAGAPLQSNYTAAVQFTAEQTAAARAGISQLLAAPQPRPVSNVVVRVRGDACGQGLALLPLFDNLTASGSLKLIGANGTPFSLPEAFALLPGSELTVLAFTDAVIPPEIQASCRSNIWEAITVGLVGVPIASDPDRNGNLLIDSWENEFFGGSPHNAFSDSDGDGYQDLQEMLEGTDPEDGNGVPGVPPERFNRPVMLVVPLPNGMIAVRWHWPARYAAQFAFGLRVSGAVTVPFSEIATAFSREGDQFTVMFPPMPNGAQFYDLIVRLR